MATGKLLGLSIFILLSNAHALQRIVGGVETTITKRPYQASLQYHTDSSIKHWCGASIISTIHLLTAAHCNPGKKLDILYARVGSTSYNSSGQLLKIEAFNAHSKFREWSLDYDFAIASFAKGVEIILGTNVAIIPLVKSGDPDPDFKVTVSGWGVTYQSSKEVPINLREVDLPVFNRKECHDEIYLFLSTRQFCLGGTQQGMLSPCNGDSGGPAVQNGIQYGLVSGGSSCEAPNIPVIFARITAVRKWITNLTGV